MGQPQFGHHHHVRAELEADDDGDHDHHRHSRRSRARQTAEGSVASASYHPWDERLLARLQLAR